MIFRGIKHKSLPTDILINMDKYGGIFVDGSGKTEIFLIYWLNKQSIKTIAYYSNPI